MTPAQVSSTPTARTPSPAPIPGRWPSYPSPPAPSTKESAVAWPASGMYKQLSIPKGMGAAVGITRDMGAALSITRGMGAVLSTTRGMCATLSIPRGMGCTRQFLNRTPQMTGAAKQNSAMPCLVSHGLCQPLPDSVHFGLVHGELVLRGAWLGWFLVSETHSPPLCHDATITVYAITDW
jgi:hypothetical protein